MTLFRRTKAAIRRRRREHSDRGAAFVEFALAVPVLVLLGLGIIESGLLWMSSNDVTAVSRNAARSGTSAPVYYTADRTILGTVGAELTTDQLDNLQRVIVFRANNAGQTSPPSNCKGLTPNDSSGAGQSGSCNVYSKKQVEQVINGTAPASKFATTSGCGSTWDRFWCPTSRNRSLSSGSLDYLGVYVETKTTSNTGLSLGNQTIGRSSVFRLEPPFGAN